MFKYEEKKDSELAILTQNNDHLAYAEIVRRYEQKLLRYTNYLIQDQEKSKDMVQNAFLKAYTNINSYDISKKFSTWIYRIVHNETINELKKYHHETPLLPDMNFVSAEDLEANVMNQEVKHKIIKCLNQIPLKYSEPLSLIYLEQKTYEEISEILRLPVNTIGTRINRAKKIMQKICQKMK